MGLIRILLAVSIVCSSSMLLAQGSDRAVAPAQAQTQSAADQPMEYKPGIGMTPPKVLHAADPEYTDKARRKKLSGVSDLTVTVGIDGLPHDIKVFRSMSEQVPAKMRDAAVSLDENAIKAIAQYRFEPATLDGRPVPVAIHIQVTFQQFR